MKNKKQTMKKILYIDYACKVGERVFWENLAKQKFEGVILEWKENCVAVVQLDDKSIIEVKC